MNSRIALINPLKAVLGIFRRPAKGRGLLTRSLPFAAETLVGAEGRRPVRTRGIELATTFQSITIQSITLMTALFSALPSMAMQAPDLDIGGAELVPFERAVANDLFDPGERAEIVSSVFADASEESLERLVLHESDSVALHAAWELLVRVLGDRCRIEDYREERRVQVHRFLGFVRGRLRAGIPQHWSETLETIDVYSNDVPWMEIPQEVFYDWGWMRPGPLGGQYKRAQAGMQTIALSKQLEVEVLDNTRGTLKMSGLNSGRSLIFDLPGTTGTESKPELGYTISACEDNSGLLLVIFPGSESALKCNYTIVYASFSPSGEGTERYRVVLNADTDRSYQRRNHAVEVSMNESRVFVFGSSVSYSWIDVIERESGKLSARFTTAYAPLRRYRYSETK